MSEPIHEELVALCERWRVRARKFIVEAEQAHRIGDIVRLTAMASTLEWAAGDLSFEIRHTAASLLTDTPKE